MDNLYVGIEEREFFTFQRPVGFSCIITGFIEIFREVTYCVEMYYFFKHFNWGDWVTLNIVVPVEFSLAL